MRKVVFFALLVACKREPTPVTATPDAATGASCAATLASYDTLVAAGGACKVDGDCECFNGGVSTKSACGGVTDRATGAKLATLAADWEHAQCEALSCAASMCRPKCSAGRCVNASAPSP